jgi:hypothetical protein
MLVVSMPVWESGFDGLFSGAMTQATIEARGRRFGQAGSGLVWAEITLQVDGEYFPDPEWTDFIVVVLGWWCGALVEILRGAQGPIDVHFMEGPYLAELRQLSGQSLRLTLVEDAVTRRVVREDDVDLAPLVQSVLSAADQILTECEQREWWSADETNLAAVRDNLRDEARVRVNAISLLKT